MTVLLIQPPSVPEWSRHVYTSEPLTLENSGAGLKSDGLAVEPLDACFDSAVEETFRGVCPDAVGSSAYAVHVPWVRRTAERLKSLAPGMWIVVGEAPCHA